MKILKDILTDKLDRYKKEGYIKHEFQDYGYRLALSLGDLRHKALYIKLAKETPRKLLEEARIYALDYYNPKSRAKVFMWKLQELREQSKEEFKKQS